MFLEEGFFQVVNAVWGEQGRVDDGKVAAVFTLVLVPVVFIGRVGDDAVRSLSEAEIIAVVLVLVDVACADELRLYSPEDSLLLKVEASSGGEPSNFPLSLVSSSHEARVRAVVSMAAMAASLLFRIVITKN